MKEYYSFKIRDRETGLFSSGGTYPHFSKTGKVWSDIGHLKSHLSLLREIPWNWEIITYVAISPSILAKDIVNMKLDDVLDVLKKNSVEHE